MRRFLDPALPGRGTHVLSGDEGEHLMRVLRARPGDEVLVFDGRGREALCRVTSVAKSGATLEIVSETTPRRAARDVVLVTAVPRGDRMEWLIEKATEAGASAVVPWAAERSVRDRAGASTLRRWRRAAVEASKQCGRADVPGVGDVASLDEALAAVAGRALFVADPAAHDGGESVRGGAERVAVVIGPEGGLTPAERQRIDEARAVPFALGPLVLRIETAAVLAVYAFSR